MRLYCDRYGKEEKRRGEEGELVKESFRVVDSSKCNSQLGRGSNDNNLFGQWVIGNESRDGVVL